MSQKKFIYNPLKLQYEEYRVSLRKKFGRFFIFFLTSIVSGFIFLLIFLAIFDSPKEKVLKKDISYLELELDVLNQKLDVVEDVLDDLEERDDNIYRVIFETNSLPTKKRHIGEKDFSSYDQLKGYANSDKVISLTQRLDFIEGQIYAQSKSYDELVELIYNKHEMLACIPAIIPVRTTDINRFASGFGYRTDPIYKVKKFHSGLDFSGPIGVSVFATGDGRVSEVVRSSSGYGNYVMIDHGFGYQTRYAHLSKITVRVGEKVKRGQEIGFMGNTGKSTGPHLHYEVLKANRPINPIHFFVNDLTPEEYETILIETQESSQTMD